MDFWWRLLRVSATGLLAEMRRHYRREDVRWPAAQKTRRLPALRSRGVTPASKRPTPGIIHPGGD